MPRPELFTPSGARLDALDLRILAILHENARTPNSQIADAVGLSHSAALQRVKRLDEGLAIRSYSAEAEESIFANWSLLVVEIAIHATAKRARDAFEGAIRQAPEVIQAFEVMGASDYIVVAAVPVVSRWIDIQARLDPDGSAIARIAIAPMVRTLKHRSAHPALSLGTTKSVR